MYIQVLKKKSFHIFYYIILLVFSFFLNNAFHIINNPKCFFSYNNVGYETSKPELNLKDLSKGK
jgi:hypothetical protein